MTTGFMSDSISLSDIEITSKYSKRRISKLSGYPVNSDDSVADPNLNS